MNNKLIYFDNAATGYPKPHSVRREAMRAFEECGGNPGRSGHILSANAAKAVFECREKVCSLINYDRPERVIFTLNATHALNIAIKGLAEPKSGIVISSLEHNSVYRPVYALCDKNKDMHFDIFDASQKSDEAVAENFRKAIRADTKVAVITVASNICGRILPVKEISEICRQNGIKLILDASQAMGEIPFDFSEIKPSVLCSAGHKGLYGPCGTGFAVFSEDINPEPIIEGGNGLVSELPTMGEELPEKLEAGTVNTPGILGLGAGIDFVRSLGVESIRKKCSQICDFLTAELKSCGAIIYGDYENKTPIILFNIPGMSPSALSSRLDTAGICTRSGIHCSPLGHKALKTGSDGAVRVSLGYANTQREAEMFISEMRKIIRNGI